MERFICTKPFNSDSHSGARPCCYHLILQMGKLRPRKVANSIWSQIQFPVLVLSTMLVNSEWSVNPSGRRKIHVFKFLANAILVSYTSMHIWTLFIWQIIINPFTYVRHGLAFVLHFVIYRMMSRHFPRRFSQPVYKETGQEFLLLSPLPGWYPNQPNLLTIPSLQLEASKEPLWSSFPWWRLKFVSSSSSWTTLPSCSHLALMLLPVSKAVNILANHIQGPCITAFANFPPPGSQEGTKKHNRSPGENLCPPYLGWELSLPLWVVVLSLTDVRGCSVMWVLALSPLT